MATLVRLDPKDLEYSERSLELFSKSLKVFGTDSYGRVEIFAYLLTV